MAELDDAAAAGLRTSRCTARTWSTRTSFHTRSQRRRRASAARTRAGVLRLLRLAFVRARPLAARTTGQAVSAGAVRGGCARGVGAEPDARAHRRRSRLLPDPGPCFLRAALRSRVAADAVRRIAHLGRPAGARMGATLAPLEAEAAQRLREWLPKLRYPIRVGEHSQTAFAFGLVHDWARVTNDPAMQSLIEAKSRAFYAGDTHCPLGYEPSGEDFLSPCLAEADLMRRILPPREYGGVAATVPAGHPDDSEEGMARAGRSHRPQRPEARAPRRPQPEPQLDAARHRAACPRATGASAHECGRRGARCGRAASRDRRTLRRRPLARHVRRLPDDARRTAGALTLRDGGNHGTDGTLLQDPEPAAEPPLREHAGFPGGTRRLARDVQARPRVPAGPHARADRLRP